MVVLAGALLLAGCATQPAPMRVLDLQYESAERSLTNCAAPPEGLAPIRVVITSATDDRTNRETIGFSDGPIYGTSILSWLRTGLRGLADFGCDVVDSATAPAGDLVQVRVSLTRLYLRAEPTSLRASVVLDVQIGDGSGVLGHTILRGDAVHASQALMGSDYQFADGVILETSNEALDDAVCQIARALRGLVEGEGR